MNTAPNLQKRADVAKKVLITIKVMNYERKNRDWDYNICTFGREYNVDYMKDGQVWIVICVPEDVIQELR